MEFNYFLPVNLIFGSGKVAVLGETTARYGHRACIVTGTGSTKRSGLLDKAVSLLAAAGVSSVVFDQVTPNPLTTTAQEGARFAAEHGCDVIVGLGGGSMMDAAKAIAFLCVNDGDISDYIFGRLPAEKALPLILVPTTCGTGSEGNGFAVLTNPENGDKKSLRSSCIIAKASIVDPELMMTMPPSVLASVGFDALCHNMEAYLSRTAQPITDLLSLEGVRLLAENLTNVYRNYDDKDGWERITFASTLGGMVINTAGCAAPHGLEHPASGLKDIVHGKGLAALTPVIYEASIESAPERFAVLSRLLGGQSEHDCADRIRGLLRSLDLELTLSDLGITREDIPWMTDNCIKVSVGNMANHPRAFSREEIAELYRKAM
ncbi:MAG: iron-containing alcohol dehydrogenase [Eubacteriales bacterium]|nr:iron-containing alcohol dehydrogenase [Eubacteriales bacterium]